MGLTGQIKNHLSAGKKEMAAKLALQLAQVKAGTNQEQLEQHRQSYENNLLRVKAALKDIDTGRKALAEVSETAGALNAKFDVSTDIGSILTRVDDTCRPDLLPVDLTRQGRFEVHIPLFPPATDEARREMLLSLTRKANVRVAPEDVPPLPAGLTGADIESLLVQAVRRAALEGKEAPTASILREALAHFRSRDYGLEKEIQELFAVREATDPKFLPESIRKRYAGAEESAALEHRIQEIGALLGTASR